MNLEFFAPCYLVITQFQNLTNTVNRSTLDKIITDLANNQTMTAIIGQVIDFFCKCSPIEIVMPCSHLRNSGQD